MFSTYGRQLISENQLVNGTWTPGLYGYDGHGNVRFLANSAGAVTDTYTYDAFGMQIARTGTTPNVLEYSGEWLDPNLSFYNLRARYYNQATGRFLTMDPAVGTILLPPTLHNYVFVGDEPVNGVDPSGMDAILENKTLRKITKGLSLQVHYLLEQRFRLILATAACEMGVALSPEEHQIFTNLLREGIPYGAACVSAEAVYNAAYDVYEEMADEYPELYEWLVALLELD